MKTAASVSLEGAEHPGAMLPTRGDEQSEPYGTDPLRRFVPTPHTAPLPMMGRTVRLETNNLRILEHMVKLFARYPGSPDGNPDFLWRIVVESDGRTSPPWPRRSAFSDHGLRFAEFGQRNFLAVDIDAREAIAFISEGLAEDALGFTSPFLDTMFYLTAGSLDLVPFSAACVALRGKGLLVLGSPDQGKTTASYLASKNGLNFHADQAVFLEREGGELRAWGDFFPVAFRPQALQHLPELRALTQRFSYYDYSCHYLIRPDSDSALAVVPVCCVVLERESASVPCLVPLAECEISRFLSAGIAFKDEDRFEAQRVNMLQALGRLPFYLLKYGSDPATVVRLFRELLTTHAMLESAP